jgi:hypothetical protein
MTELSTGRMLLSHNYALTDTDVPALSRSEFAQMMVDGLNAYPDLLCTAVDSAHWIVAVSFKPTTHSPQQVGEACAQALVQHRLTQSSIPFSPFHVLALGGCKTTPALAPAPNALQPGEWGVDIVETPSTEQFLQELGWEAVIATKSPESIFQVDLICGKAPSKG